MLTIEKYAKQLREGFALTPNKKWEATTEEADELVHDVHRALNLTLPDDWTFEQVVHVLDAIIDARGDEDNAEMYYVEPDIWDSDLLKWLTEYPNAIAEVDEARDMYGPDSFNGIMDEIRAGQREVKSRIFHVVYRHIEDAVYAEAEE